MMRGLFLRVKTLWRSIAIAFAEYPLTFFLGISLIVILIFLWWLKFDLQWVFNWGQLKRYLSSNSLEITALAAVTFAAVFIISSFLHKKIFGQKQASYEKELKTKSSKVIIPHLRKVHHHYISKSNHYQKWHSQPHTSVIHLSLLALALFAATQFTIASISAVRASHGCADAVNITTNTSWLTDQCHGDVTVSDGAILTIAGGVTADLTSLTLGNGVTNGFITAQGDTLNNLGVVFNIDGIVDIKTGSRIDASGQGYDGGAGAGDDGGGPGGGKGGTSEDGGGGGAGYGGDGAYGRYFGQGDPGLAYGDPNAPDELGSGGGNIIYASPYSQGTDGGGAIKINAPNSTVTINGQVLADGVSASSAACGTTFGETFEGFYSVAGGGSGGSIWIEAGTLEGTGTVRANGGGCWLTRPNNFVPSEQGSHAGGAGGRILLNSTTDNSNLTKQAYGGARTVAVPYRQKGGAGTIVTNNDLVIANAQVNPTHTITDYVHPYYPNGDPVIAGTPFLTGTYNYDSVTISRGSRAVFGGDVTFDGGDLTVSNGTAIANMRNFIDTLTTAVNIPTFNSINVNTNTILAHYLNDSTQDHSLNIHSVNNITIDGSVDVTAMGYAPAAPGGTTGEGPGGGGGSAVAGGGGGGYGGVGGDASGGGTGGPTYGNQVEPNDIGSGGGSSLDYHGGGGGGSVTLDSDGDIVVNGFISASGSSAVYPGFPELVGGAGSGGSILLYANAITGSGNILANGGSATGANGCGGGGRIDTYADSSAYLGTVTASAGTGSGCAAGTINVPAVLDNFLVAGHASPTTAGDLGTITVTARDSDNNTITTYTGEISFSSDDSQAELPTNYTFTGGDSGVKTFTDEIRLKTAGTRSVTVVEVANPSNTGSQTNIIVNPASASSLVLSGFPNEVASGGQNSVTVTLKDDFNNVATGYTGTVEFTSSDTEATLPSNYTFTGADAGTKDFTGIIFKSVGTHSLTVTDTVTPTLTATKSGIAVTAAAKKLNITVIPEEMTAGESSGVITVQRLDINDNPVTGGSTTVSLESDSSSSSKKFSKTANGTATETIKINNGSSQANFYYYDQLIGSKKITVSSLGLTSDIGEINVLPGAASVLVLSEVTSPVPVGGSSGLRIEVEDDFENRIKDYRGTVKITSTDSKAVPANNYTFVAANDGTVKINKAVTFFTPGRQGITATDISDSSITGTISGIIVTPITTKLRSVPGKPTVELNGTVTAGNPEFSGKIDQTVNSRSLTLDVNGTLIDGKLTANATGIYGDVLMKGTIVATVIDGKITAGLLVLFVDDSVATAVDFVLETFVVGTVTTLQPTTGSNYPNSGCLITGQVTFEVNGRQFTGTGKFRINKQGKIVGSVSGSNGNRRAFGRLKPADYRARVIRGDISELVDSKQKLTTNSKAVGNLKKDDIVIDTIENCTITPELEFEGPGIKGEGTSVITTPEIELVGENEITGVVNGISTNTENPEEQVLVNGIIVTKVRDVVIGIQSGEYTVIEVADVVSGLSTIIGLAAALILLPTIQAEILTSSARGASLATWIFGVLPPNDRRRKNRWGRIIDNFTGVPVAGALVRLVELKSRETVKSMRTDRTGSFGFIVDQPAKYYVAITDPLYEAFASEVIEITDVKKPISRDIGLEPVVSRRRLFSQKTLHLLHAFQYLTILHWPLLIIGTGFAGWLYIDFPTIPRLLILGIYIAIWLSKILRLGALRRYGMVKSADGKPLANAVVQLTKDNSSGVESHIYSSVTDERGRFLLIAQRSSYQLTVTKEGFQPYFTRFSGDSTQINVQLRGA